MGIIGGGLVTGAGASAIFYKKLQKQLKKQGYQLNTIEQLYTELQKSGKAVDNSYIESIEALVRALEARDMYTRGHSDRVNRFSVAIAKQLGLSFEEINLIHHGSLLHDIGKIGVHDRILLKPKPLNDEEFKIMKEHPEHGVQILAHSKTMKEILPIILHHHEQQDGTGYPLGLKGDEIPLGARIVQVADTWDAMRSDRPYRKRLDVKVCRERLEEASGKQLDPNCVNAFLKCIHPKTGGLILA